MSWWDNMVAKMKLADHESKERMMNEENGYIRPRKQFYETNERYEERLQPYKERQRIESIRKRNEEIEEFKRLYDNAIRFILRYEFDEVETIIHDLECYPNYSYSEIGSRSIDYLKIKFERQQDKFKRYCYSDDDE